MSSEQFGGGGLATARGYLEAEALGDNAIFGTLEFRSPSLLPMEKYPGGDRSKTPSKTGNEWRIYTFVDAGSMTIHDPLPDQQASFQLASVGFGSRIQLFDHLNGSVDFALPLYTVTQTEAHNPRITFRVWADF